MIEKLRGKKTSKISFTFQDFLENRKSTII